VSPAVDLAIVVLLRAAGRVGDETRPDVVDRQVIPEHAVIRRGVDELVLAERRSCREPETHPAAHAPLVPDADLPEARHQQLREGAQDLLLSARRAAGGPAQPGLVRRHHLHPDAARLPLTGGCYGLVQRKVLAWRISNTHEAEFCFEARN
jgi:hypothetical protein